MLSIKIDKLRAYLQNTRQRTLVEEKIEKTAISIRAVLTNYVKAIRYLQGIERTGSRSLSGTGCAVSVRTDPMAGCLSLQRRHPCFPEAGYLDVAVNCHPRPAGDGENRNRRVWIFADELPRCTSCLTGRNPP